MLLLDEEFRNEQAVAYPGEQAEADWATDLSQDLKHSSREYPVIAI